MIRPAYLFVFFLALSCFSIGDSVAANPIYISLAAKVGFGKAQSADKSSVPARTMIVPAVEGVIAWRPSFFLLGVSGEYAWWRQFTKPSSVGDSNLQGSMLIITPAAGFGTTSFKLLFRYFPLVSKFDLDKANLAGEKQSYLAADQLGIQALIRVAGNSFFGVEYVKNQFYKVEAKGKETVLAAGSEAQFNFMGVMYVARF